MGWNNKGEYAIAIDDSNLKSLIFYNLSFNEISIKNSINLGIQQANGLSFLTEINFVVG